MFAASTNGEPTVRLGHFSDVHITVQRLGWKWREFFGKRFTGWMNLKLLGRGLRFRHAAAVARVLVHELKQRRPDHLVFSGDATALAFEAEFAAAAKVLAVNDPDMPPCLAIPGNHDCYTRKPVREALFERYFAPWQVGERIDDAIYPFAQQAGHVWIVGLNSSTYNLFPWDASGGVGAAQRDRLKRLLAELPAGPRILVTHYPAVRPKGTPDHRLRRMRDWRETIRIAAEGGVRLWLHGHRHHPFHLPETDNLPFPVICAGSATQTRIWMYNEYTITGTKLTAVKRIYAPHEQVFHDRDTFELALQ